MRARKPRTTHRGHLGGSPPIRQPALREIPEPRSTTDHGFAVPIPNHRIGPGCGSGIELARGARLEFHPSLSGECDVSDHGRYRTLPAVIDRCQTDHHPAQPDWGIDIRANRRFNRSTKQVPDQNAGERPAGRAFSGSPHSLGQRAACGALWLACRGHRTGRTGHAAFGDDHSRHCPTHGFGDRIHP